jgi:UDP-N-acetylmuramyl pentapeptide phosphotransferase/UDP-N-acetylglucosamine-1-phosphate transferase
MQEMAYALAFFGVFTAVLFGTGVTAMFLRARAILDHPNERSSHRAPTPRGGGIAIVVVLGVSWPAIAFFTSGQPAQMTTVIACAAALAAVSWVDDLRSLNPAWRLAAQFLAAAAGLVALPESLMVFQGLLAPMFDRIAAVLLWVWFVNLFNFMDGIDGIAGAEAAAIAAGLFLIAVLIQPAASEPGFGFYALTIAAAALGFLWWNWEPAKVFLGDVGSVPLGFLLGFLLLQLAASGAWAAALILPLYYLADSGITLAIRLSEGERIWRAHARHFYQQAARRFGSHARVVKAVIAADVLLVALALVSVGFPWPALAGAGAVVAALLYFLARGGAGKPGKSAPARG